ncbi:MAG: tRNA (adenosine(37)-N6)-threonylcarbamoyltransferase complex ATPase subunit type 1 TsaE [Pseudomonadota bacterium]
MKFHSPSSDHLEAIGQTLANQVEAPLVVYLSGELGAGKTTFVRGFMRGKGHDGPIKSPTYTLVESYAYQHLEVECELHHFDLYRLADPEELEFLGIRDYFAGATICMIEWPDRGAGMIAEADLFVDIQYAGNGREIRLSGTCAQNPDVRSALLSEFSN